MKIRSDILRVYQSLHTWTGILAGTLLFIGFFAGALTMFKEPLDRWASSPAHRLAGVAPERLDLLVRAVLAAEPAARKQFTLHLSPHENTPAPLSWSSGKSGREVDLSASRRLATLDGGGNLVTADVVPSALARLIDMLHRTGGVPGSVDGEYLGVYLMGVAGVLYFLALVSGVILLLPTMVKDFFALRQGKNRKRFWLDAHNVIGIASLPFHLVISLTVIVFAFHDQFYDGLAGAVYDKKPDAPTARAKPYKVDAMLPASALLARVRQEAPGLEVTELLFMRLETPRPLVRAAVEAPRHMVRGAHSGFVMIHPYTGEIASTAMLPGKQDTWTAAITPLFSLHFGSYGGDLVRWIYFAFGLGGAFLFYSGNLLWLEKRRKNQVRGQAPAAQTRNTQTVGAVTLGLCLGTVAGVCVALAAGKWKVPLGDGGNQAYLAVYYSVLLAALAWALWRGVARAAGELLYACAAASLLVPLTSALAVLLPGLGMWTHAGAATLAVDATALAAALALAWAGRLSARRAWHGPRDSIWSAHASALGHAN